jgi:hypothetical protein
VKAVVAVVALAAALFGGVGALPLLLETRLAALAPGGVAAAALSYNPLSGRLTLRAVTARDATGREVFRADEVEATTPLLELFGDAPLTLQRVRVVSPRLVLAPTRPLTLVGLGARGLAGARVVVDGLAVTHGALVVEEPGRRALEARDVTARLDGAGGFVGGDGAFAVETVLYGAAVRVTGQSLGHGAYALHVRASDLDAAALLEDFPQVLEPAGMRRARGRADVDARLVVTGSRVLASGQLRIDGLVARFAERRSAPLAAASLVLAVDRWDVAAGVGRISRLELRRPTLMLDDRGTPGAISALVDRLRSPDVVLRRLRIVDGTVRLTNGTQRVTLRGFTLALQSAAETGPRAGFVLTARASVGAAGRLALDGALSRDLQRVEGAVRAIGVTLEGCGLQDVSMPVPPDVSVRVVLSTLASACDP